MAGSPVLLARLFRERFSGVREDSYRYGGSSECSFGRQRPSRPRRCGQAWFGRPGLPRVLQLLQCGQPVRPGLVPAGSPLPGSLCGSRDVSVIFDSLTVGLGRLCGVGTCPVRTPWHPIGARLWKGRCTTGWLFCWLL